MNADRQFFTYTFAAVEFDMNHMISKKPQQSAQQCARSWSLS